MSTIIVSIIESDDQVISGFPKSITLTADSICSIFYTLDGADPTLFSNIYTDPIFLATDQLSITLKTYATDGVNNSVITTNVYQTNILQNARRPRATTDAPAGSKSEDLYPFGTNSPPPTSHFFNAGNIEPEVSNPDLAQIPSGFDGYGNPTGFTNHPYTIENYQIKYSTKNSIGQEGPGIGNLPGITKIKKESSPPSETQQFSKMFDPRALVIFQDFSKEDLNDPVQINRQFFNLDNPEKDRDGNQFISSGLDSPTVTGSFIRAFHNPKDNTITHYYRDSISNRWIISKAPYKPTGNFSGNLSGIISSRTPGSRFVIPWIIGMRRVLF